MSDVPANAFELPLVVGADDIDVQEHVSNVTVVKWFSRGAWLHSKSLGYDMARYHALGAWFVVRRHEIDYHRSARLGDELVLSTWPSALGKATAERRYVLRARASGERIAAGKTLWAFIEIATGRPRRIAGDVAAAFDPNNWST